MAVRYNAEDLIAFSEALFIKAGMDKDKAGIVAPLLVEADLMGHTTHGLQLCGPYLDALQTGAMIGTGEPEVVSDNGAAITWQGNRISGVWLTAKAIDLAVERSETHGVVTVAIQRSHHIACLAAFLERATAKNCMVIITSCDPSQGSVAPFGGTKAIYTPDPIAVGIPTGGDPILVDISASITTNGLTGRLYNEGKKMDHEWVQDAEGNLSKDPAVLFDDPPGTILPIGGHDYGHKGYGLALMIEAMCTALTGHGRADPPEGWGAGVFVQVLNPAKFAGVEAFNRQMSWLADACHANPPRAGFDSVRLPGDGALSRKRNALEQGVELYPGIMDGLADWGGKLGVDVPAAR